MEEESKRWDRDIRIKWRIETGMCHVCLWPTAFDLLVLWKNKALEGTDGGGALGYKAIIELAFWPELFACVSDWRRVEDGG